MVTLGQTRVVARATAVVTAEVAVDADVRTVRPDNPSYGRECKTGYFNEWSVELFGWALTVAVSFDLRPSCWGLFCRWLHKDRAEMPRGWVWWCSWAAATLCVGPVAVDVSALRTGPSGRRVPRWWKGAAR